MKEPFRYHFDITGKLCATIIWSIYLGLTSNPRTSALMLFVGICYIAQDLWDQYTEWKDKL